jgi:hypothetical protein
MTRPTGRELNSEWGVGAQHALYSRRGTWYHRLERFPGALFDANGFVLFASKRAYEGCSHLNIGQEVNVRGGIASIPGYVKMRTQS